MDKVMKEPLFSDRAYDIAKHIVQIVLPAIGTLYFAIAAIWGLPYAQEVVGTLAAIAMFLGVTLSLSDRRYDKSDAKFDGDAIVTNTPAGGTMYTLALNGDPESLKDKKELVFKVILTSEG